ncbi:MAG TPA: MarR family transcriptional regulator [Clostridia bacterium]|nr:MarR family transcriptional regulator [Clostridia bacterium]
MEEMSNGLKVLKLMKQATNSLKHNVMEHFREMQLTAPQGMLIGILAHHDKMKVSDLSEKLGLSNSTVSGIIDRLEKQGFVERVRSEEDRRVVYISLSPDFRKSSKEHNNVIGKMLDDVMNKATPEELDSIMKGLETLNRLIDSRKGEL